MDVFAYFWVALVRLFHAWLNSSMLLKLSVMEVSVMSMMTSSNGNIFRVTGHLCGEFTGHRWIPLTKASNAELWCFVWSAPWINGWVNNRKAGDLRRHRDHYDVIVMFYFFLVCCVFIHECLCHWLIWTEPGPSTSCKVMLSSFVYIIVMNWFVELFSIFCQGHFTGTRFHLH